jgi:hypothetical protein
MDKELLQGEAESADYGTMFELMKEVWHKELQEKSTVQRFYFHTKKYLDMVADALRKDSNARERLSHVDVYSNMVIVTWRPKPTYIIFTVTDHRP